jgi:hypothetical protein
MLEVETLGEKQFNIVDEDIKRDLLNMAEFGMNRGVP